MAQHLFFDLDGTLSDSAEGIVRCVQHAMAVLGHAPAPASAIRPLTLLATRAARGFGLHVATGKPAIYAHRLLDHLKILRHFVAVHAPGLQALRYTKTEVVRRALDAHALSATAVTMIGDRSEDVSAARECGMRSIAVGWGYGDRAELLDARPDHLVTSPQELLAVLDENAGRGARTYLRSAGEAGVDP